MSTVFVGLSGGVDSAVSAALLRSAGHEVVGVFIKIWQPEFLECSWRADRLDAMRVAASLSIPFREIDLSRDYEQRVVRTMIDAYARGRTPNPDIACNESVKFGAFAAWALKEGASAVATGHYARRETTGGRPCIARGIDAAKDQSYFLCRTPAAILDRIMFPIGGMRKDDVRRAALRYALPNAAKPDSQGLCFVGDISMPEFLRRFMTPVPGEVLDSAGMVIGRHEGAVLYTIGQRHGFVLTNAPERPHYVLGTDVERNTITVTDDRSQTMRASIAITDPVWHIGPVEGRSYLAQVRYREAPSRAELRNATIVFEQPRVIAPGQSVVLYDGDRMLGGGVAS